MVVFLARTYVPQLNEYSKSIKLWDNFLQTLTPVFQKKKKICLDFSRCHFISTDGVALLSGLKFIRDAEGYKTIIDDTTIKDHVRIVLDRWGFLDLFQPETHGKTIKQSNTTTLPIHRQKKLDIDELASYMDEQILKRPEMPSMSQVLHKEIRKAFFEVFSNIFTHSESSIGGLVCGQIFPNDKIIQIVFYDGGIGIAKNVRSSQSSILSDENAIEWALQRGTSTLSSESVSRGLGLYLLRMFIRANEGEFRIYSNEGAVTEVNKKLECRRLSCAIQGALIDIRIKIRDDVKYTLFSKDEV